MQPQLKIKEIKPSKTINIHQLLLDIKKHSKVLFQLYKLDESILQNVATNTILDIISKIKNLTNASGARVYIKDKDNIFKSTIIDINEINNPKNINLTIDIDKPIRIDNINETKLDLSSLKEFDQNNNFQTISILFIPLKNYKNEITGILELLNKKHVKKGIVNFNIIDEIVASLIINRFNILNSYIKLINTIEIIKKDFQNIKFDNNDLKDKILTKFELLKSQKEIEFLKTISIIQDDKEMLKYRQEYKKNMKQLDLDKIFLEGKFDKNLDDKDIQKIKQIASYKILINKHEQNLLNDKEIEILISNKNNLFKNIEKLFLFVK